jgi:4-amino-4-deoxy-L-arabinose transferase
LITHPPAPVPFWRELVAPLALALALWATFVLKLHNLDHSALGMWDEVYHAVVARNVMKHPLTPTFVDEPYLPYEIKQWTKNHVWLHKPILPFWQIAVSFALLGVDAFSLRLPAAILTTGAALLTYLIGKELLDRRAALFAAVLQAVNPFVMTLVQGYQFGDQVDAALLFWVEVAIYFLVRGLRSGAWADFVLAGFAQGLAFLCKSYLASLVLGLALTAWLLPLLRLAPRERCRIGGPQLVALSCVTVLTVVPWLLACLVRFPEEMAHEELQIWMHLTGNVEGWGAPWDRVLFDYLVAMYGAFYTPCLVAALGFVVRAIRARDAGLLLLYAWLLGVLVPHVFAVSKTPSATLIAMPAFLLILGYLIAEATRGDRWALSLLTGVLLMSIAQPAEVRRPGYGFPPGRAFASLLRQALWVIYHVVGAFVFAGVVEAFAWWLRRTALDRTSPIGLARWPALAFCCGALAWLGYGTTMAGWRVTDEPANDEAAVQVGRFVQGQLPANAVLLTDQPEPQAAAMLMFYADRTCYAFVNGPVDGLARRIAEAGGVPYIVSRRRLSLPILYRDPRGPTVYQYRPA